MPSSLSPHCPLGDEKIGRGSAVPQQAVTLCHAQPTSALDRFSILHGNRSNAPIPPAMAQAPRVERSRAYLQARRDDVRSPKIRSLDLEEATKIIAPALLVGLLSWASAGGVGCRDGTIYPYQFTQARGGRPALGRRGGIRTPSSACCARRRHPGLRGDT